MQSGAETVEDYLAEIPEDRQRALEKVRSVILANLPQGMKEVMNWGMISYEVPLEICPDTYNGQPLMYAALANQKKHMAVYLMGIYSSGALRTRFEEAYRKTGKRMDMGKSCVRFKNLEDLPTDLIGQAIGSFDMKSFLQLVETQQKNRRSKKGKTSR